MSKYVPPHRRSTNTSNRQPQKIVEQDDSLADVVDAIWVINLDERRDKWAAFQREANIAGIEVERVSAVNGAHVVESKSIPEDVCLEWEAAQNAHYSPKTVTAAVPGQLRTMTAGEVGCALTHVALWRRLAATTTTTSTSNSKNFKTVLILEDDAVLTKNREGQTRFQAALRAAWSHLEPDFAGLLYLGFSSRGKRLYLEKDKSPDASTAAEVTAATTTAANSRPSRHHGNHSQGARPEELRSKYNTPQDEPHRNKNNNNNNTRPVVRLYRPEYGYQTHAYILTKAAAQVLVNPDHLPVTGPVDVWLADHKWFGLPVYSAVIAGEGWRCPEDGTYEGAPLVTQNRGLRSDVVQSSTLSV